MTELLDSGQDGAEVGSRTYTRSAIAERRHEAAGQYRLSAAWVALWRRKLNALAKLDAAMVEREQAERKLDVLDGNAPSARISAGLPFGGTFR
jgi:hypothetical protein